MKFPFRNISFSTAAQKTNKKDLNRALDYKILWLAKLCVSQPGVPSYQRIYWKRDGRPRAWKKRKIPTYTVFKSKRA